MGIFESELEKLYREYAYKYVIVIIFFLSAIASSIYPYVMAPYATQVVSLYKV